jgi:cytochrome c biogenesis protein CcmG, thiol:disulfide interchange protein DsbE
VTTIRARLAALLALGLVGPALVACSGGGPRDAVYTFHTGDSNIRVDTPELRAIKAAADIQPCPAPTKARPAAASGLPNLTLPCLGGGPDVDLATLRGPLLLNFWAQTCDPCRKESPLLQKLSTTAKGKVRVVGVDFLDARPSWALGFAKQLGLTYPQIADPVGAAKGPLRIAGLPYTFFVDAAGKVTHVEPGAITSQDQLASLVHEYLGVSVRGSAGT